ncbi:MAG: hypothetical protein LBB53_02805 [Prevotellaceae bacterium]|nr:hypothetical protein [Prevotellaceae bacterium]
MSRKSKLSSQKDITINSNLKNTTSNRFVRIYSTHQAVLRSVNEKWQSKVNALAFENTELRAKFDGQVEKPFIKWLFDLFAFICLIAGLYLQKKFMPNRKKAMMT